MRGHAADLWAVTFSPDGKSIATASMDHSVKVWDVADRCERFTLVGHQHEVNSIVYLPDGRFLATAGDDQTARL